jgi:hypothetical protein
LYEKLFVVNQINDDSNATDYENTVSADFYGSPMRGLPFPSSLTKFTFCVPPGDYVLHAVDSDGDGWWGGARYSVIVDGATAIDEEMNRTSSTRQSTTFTVALPQSTRTAFSNNKALQGGGGALFWEDEAPTHTERYRNESTSNTALYGSFAATPARVLSTTNHTYHAISGISMASGGIAAEFKDR